MITLNVRRAARLKGITRPLRYLTANGFTYHTARILLSGKALRVDLRDIERLCRILHCEPHDLMDYAPPTDFPIGAEDRLAFLSKHNLDADIHQMIAKLSLKEMAALTAEVAARYAKAG